MRFETKVKAALLASVLTLGPSPAVKAYVPEPTDLLCGRVISRDRIEDTFSAADLDHYRDFLYQEILFDNNPRVKYFLDNLETQTTSGDYWLIFSQIQYGCRTRLTRSEFEKRQVFHLYSANPSYGPMIQVNFDYQGNNLKSRSLHLNHDNGSIGNLTTWRSTSYEQYVDNANSLIPNFQQRELLKAVQPDPRDGYLIDVKEDKRINYQQTTQISNYSVKIKQDFFP